MPDLAFRIALALALLNAAWRAFTGRQNPLRVDGRIVTWAYAKPGYDDTRHLRKATDELTRRGGCLVLDGDFEADVLEVKRGTLHTTGTLTLDHLILESQLNTLDTVQTRLLTVPRPPSRAWTREWTREWTVLS